MTKFLFMGMGATLLNTPIQYTDTSTYRDWLEAGLSKFRENKNLALDKNWTVFNKSQNELIRYRIKNKNINNKNYLRNLFNINKKKKDNFFCFRSIKRRKSALSDRTISY